MTDLTPRLMQRITRPSGSLRARLQIAGICVGPVYHHRDDTREMVIIQIPNGWSFIAGDRVSVISDDMGKIRFVDLAGDEDREARFYEVYMPDKFQSILKGAFVRHGGMLLSDEPPDVMMCSMISWLHANKPASLRLLFIEDGNAFEREVIERNNAMPAPQTIPTPKVVQVEVATTKFRRPIRS